MHAVTIHEVGGPEVLRWDKAEVREPGVGEVLVDARFAGVNYRDVYFRNGMYKAPLPFVPGIEGSGVVSAVGPGVTSVAPGDRVAWTGDAGSYAERITLPADAVLPIPDSVSFEHAAAVLLQGLTVHVLANDCGPVRDGEWIAVHAAAGGIGLLLTQVAKHRGAKVLGTVSAEEKMKAVLDAGADAVTTYGDFSKTAAELTDGHGLNAVYDGVGAATLSQSIEALESCGRLVLFGWASGPVPTLPLDRLRSCTFVRPRLGDYLTPQRGEAAERSAEIFSWMAEGVVTPTIDSVYPMDRAADAHRALESRRTIGKVLLATTGVK
ncbi:quinone oxidoreductase family protein [Streptomyces canus]|uniref:quinone oxidoreductase family protein n=1 Tax=Streptomyces TaxID=1883 RepID=UPI000851EB6E|nr:quinone oxidoreductase [Streptomyces sp. LUP47B]